jgi:hypothetical protein
MLWLIVASAAGRLVYHIPEGKPYLAPRRSKNAKVRSDWPDAEKPQANENARP